jgi:hypothetical protein
MLKAIDAAPFNLHGSIVTKWVAGYPISQSIEFGCAVEIPTKTGANFHIINKSEIFFWSFRRESANAGLS